MLMTTVDGFQLVSTAIYENALHRLNKLCEDILPLRSALLHDIEKMKQLDKNTYARSIRLIDRFVKEVNELCQIHP